MVTDELDAATKRKIRDYVPYYATWFPRGRTDSGRARTRRVPIEVIPGGQEPKVEGCGYWKTTLRSGPKFSKVLYTPSTLRIEVGLDWIKENL